MNNISRRTLPSPDLVTVAEAADILRVTDRTVRRMIERGQLTAHRLGTRAIRLERHEVLLALTPIANASAGHGLRPGHTRP